MSLNSCHKICVIKFVNIYFDKTKTKKGVGGGNRKINVPRGRQEEWRMTFIFTTLPPSCSILYFILEIININSQFLEKYIIRSDLKSRKCIIFVKSITRDI